MSMSSQNTNHKSKNRQEANEKTSEEERTWGKDSHRTAEKYLQVIDKYAKGIISKYVRDSYSIMPGNPYNLAFLRPKNLNNMIL